MDSLSAAHRRCRCPAMPASPISRTASRWWCVSMTAVPITATASSDVSNKAAQLLDFKGNGRGARPGRICRPGAAGGNRRSSVDGDAADRHPGAGAIAGAGGLRPSVRAGILGPWAADPGEVPMPEGRPYNLGNTSADQVSLNATSEMSASRPRALERRNAR